MFEKLIAPGFIEAPSAHEPAHISYYQLMPPIVYEPLKPELRYDSYPKERFWYRPAIGDTFERARSAMKEPLPATLIPEGWKRASVGWQQLALALILFDKARRPQCDPHN
jgi:hypothetical protein